MSRANLDISPVIMPELEQFVLNNRGAMPILRVPNTSLYLIDVFLVDELNSRTLEYHNSKLSQISKLCANFDGSGYILINAPKEMGLHNRVLPLRISIPVHLADIYTTRFADGLRLLKTPIPIDVATDEQYSLFGKCSISQPVLTQEIGDRPPEPIFPEGNFKLPGYIYSVLRDNNMPLPVQLTALTGEILPTMLNRSRILTEEMIRLNGYQGHESIMDIEVNPYWDNYFKILTAMTKALDAEEFYMFLSFYIRVDSESPQKYICIDEIASKGLLSNIAMGQIPKEKWSAVEFFRRMYDFQYLLNPGIISSFDTFRDVCQFVTNQLGTKKVDFEDYLDWVGRQKIIIDPNV